LEKKKERTPGTPNTKKYKKRERLAVSATFHQPQKEKKKKKARVDILLKTIFEAHGHSIQKKPNPSQTRPAGPPQTRRNTTPTPNEGQNPTTTPPKTPDHPRKDRKGKSLQNHLARKSSPLYKNNK